MPRYLTMQTCNSALNISVTAYQLSTNLKAQIYVIPFVQFEQGHSSKILSLQNFLPSRDALPKVRGLLAATRLQQWLWPPSVVAAFPSFKLSRASDSSPSSGQARFRKCWCFNAIPHHVVNGSWLLVCGLDIHFWQLMYWNVSTTVIDTRFTEYMFKIRRECWVILVYITNWDISWSAAFLKRWWCGVSWW